MAGRAVYLQAVNTDFLQMKGESRFSRVLEVPATRGRILDRNGQILAYSVDASASVSAAGDIWSMNGHAVATAPTAATAPVAM